MVTVADTIQAKFTASWSAGAQPTGFATSDFASRPAVIAEFINYMEDMLRETRRRSTKGYDHVTVMLPLEAYTRTSQDRLDAIVAEIRSLCHALAPATYDSVETKLSDQKVSRTDRKEFGSIVEVTVITYAEAR